MNAEYHGHAHYHGNHVPPHVLKKNLWESFDGLRFLQGAYRENFQDDKVGTFPKGWLDFGQGPAGTTAPDPSAIVVRTTDAWGHPTKALQILSPDIGELPVTDPGTGIYRPIELAKHYEINVDVRIDKFSDVTDFDCGCPEHLKAVTDHPVNVSFISTVYQPDVFQAPWMGVYASARTEDWRLFVYTDNVQADVPLGVSVELGKWYSVDFEVDPKGTAHSIISDTKTGMTLGDFTTDLTKLGNWDPRVDGAFNIVASGALNLTAIEREGSAVIDNLSVSGKPLMDHWLS